MQTIASTIKTESDASLFASRVQTSLDAIVYEFRDCSRKAFPFDEADNDRAEASIDYAHLQNYRAVIIG